jgi:hypothetical protein
MKSRSTFAFALLLAASSPLAFVASCGGGDSTANGNDGGTDGTSPQDGAPGDALGDSRPQGDADAHPSDGTAGDSGGDSATMNDSSSNDTGSNDTGTVDTGTSDTGAGDTGSNDTGTADTGMSDSGGNDGGNCGICPAGFSCGPSNYCVNANGVPAFGHVYVIMMENHSLASIQGSASAPYINQLMTTYANATNYTAITHPSLPNYISITSGSFDMIGCDCMPTGTACTAFTCNIFSGACGCPVPGAAPSNLGDQLDTASVTWREYAEDAMGPCDLNGDHGSYAMKHVPFLYYTDIQTPMSRCVQHVRPYTDFAGDLGTYRYSIISPNLCNDMHDTCAAGDAIAQGDTWLHTNVPPILATAGFQAGGKDVLFIVWDEQDTFGAPAIPAIIISPLGRPMSTTAAAYNHYSLLGTVEQGFGVPYLGMAGTPINDVWR